MAWVYSEPQSGSDLAALRNQRTVRADDEGSQRTEAILDHDLVGKIQVPTRHEPTRMRSTRMTDKHGHRPMGAWHHDTAGDHHVRLLSCQHLHDDVGIPGDHGRRADGGWKGI